MGTISGGGYANPDPDERIDRTATGVFSNGWESFRRDWESLKLDWKTVEGELKRMDKQRQEEFLARARETTLRLRAIIGSE